MKVVVVPAQPAPPPVQSPPSTTLRYTVVDGNGTCVYPPLFAQNMMYTPPPTPVPPPRDPMIDYYALYTHEDPKIYSFYGACFSTSIMVQNHELSSKVWELRTITDWINNNCQDIVLVQRSWDGSYWQLVFISNQDIVGFRNWYYALKINHFVIAIQTEEREKEFKDWLAGNVLGAKRTAYSMIDGRKSVTVSVRDQNEELLLKLRWFGVPDAEEDEA